MLGLVAVTAGFWYINRGRNFVCARSAGGAACALIDVTANSMPVTMPVTKLTFFYILKIIGMFLCHRVDA